jgi:hypothetical protein
VALAVFSTPGSVDDLSDAGRAAWSRDLEELLQDQIKGDPSVPNDSPRPQFFSPLGTDLDQDATRKVMAWGAFPRKLAPLPAPRRWLLAEERARQEEYCEWAALRDRRGRVVKAMFTTEVPGYFHLLAADEPDRLGDVYREHVDEQIERKQLLNANDSYKEQNSWNLVGAMHMIQPSNTLPAAAILVAQSTIVRSRDGRPLTNSNDLIRCGVAADMDRNSDPLIVGDVNALARQGAAVTLDDPVGLYIDNLQTEGWVTPDGSDPQAFWKVTRGDADHAVRAVYQVPAERGFTVSDIEINGRPIESSSQIAEFIQVKVVGLAHGFDKNAQQPRGCSDDATVGGLESLAAARELPRISDLIASARRSR